MSDFLKALRAYSEAVKQPPENCPPRGCGATGNPDIDRMLAGTFAYLCGLETDDQRMEHLRARHEWIWDKTNRWAAQYPDLDLSPYYDLNRVLDEWFRALWANANLNGRDAA